MKANLNVRSQCLNMFRSIDISQCWSLFGLKMFINICKHNEWMTRCWNTLSHISMYTHMYTCTYTQTFICQTPFSFVVFKNRNFKTVPHSMKASFCSWFFTFFKISYNFENRKCRHIWKLSIFKCLSTFNQKIYINICWSM